MFELKTNYLNHKRVHPHLGVIVNNKKFITLNPLTEHVSIFRRHYQASECQTFVSMNFDRLNLYVTLNVEILDIFLIQMCGFPLFPRYMYV